MIEFIIKFGKGYNNSVYQMFFHNRDEMFDFIKKIDSVSNKPFNYEWEELDTQVELNFNCNVCGKSFKDIETFSEHKLTQH